MSPWPPSQFTTQGFSGNRASPNPDIFSLQGSAIRVPHGHYFHTVDDYEANGPAGVVARRWHRYRDMAEIGSFGPGVFSSYDVRLHMFSGPEYYGTGIGPVRMFDPATLGTTWLNPSNPSAPSLYRDYYSNTVGSLTFYDAQDAVSNLSDAVYAILITKSKEEYHFDIVKANSDTVSGTNLPLDGRLTKIIDRLGRSTDIAYKTWTQTEIDASPERQWQIDTVTDSYGKTLTFSYGTSQVAGQWAVSEIALPNGESLQYAYSGGFLSSVTYPNSDQSTFTYTANSASNCTVLEMNDVAAAAGDGQKSVYLGNQFYSNYTGVYDQPANFARIVANGNDEVTYAQMPVDTQTAYIYEGKGLARKLEDHTTTKRYEAGWTFNGSGGITGQLEPTSFSQYGASATSIRDDRGIATYLSYDADNWITRKSYADGTFEAWCYNSFKQPTRHRDRLARVTHFVYDARGNLLERREGLVDTSPPPTGGGGSYGGTYGYGGSYNPCDATNDVQTAEYAVYQWEYYAQGHVNEYLLKAAIDPEGNRTDYEYDTSDRLVKIIQPADTVGGTRPEITYAYNTAGRLSSVTNQEGATTSYTYDLRGRHIKTTYADGSTERTVYGTGTTAGLVVKTVDRNNVVTNYGYDASGRRTSTTYAAAIMDAAGNESAVSNSSVTITENCTYLLGTRLQSSCTRAGEKTEYIYDYRHRVVETKQHPNTQTTLTTKRTYVKNQLFSTEDPYGRKTYYAYSASTGRPIRAIQTAVPSVTFADQTALLNATRLTATTPNPPFVIMDYVYDAEGQQISSIDPNGYLTSSEYDSRGRKTKCIESAGTAAAITTETDYDLNSRPVTIRHPRYFDATDTNGYQASQTTMTYTGRGRLASRTEAPGTAVAATESFEYTLDGRRSLRTDFRGKLWTSMYPSCCGSEQVTMNPLGDGVITHSDPTGCVTHQIVVSDLPSHTDLHDPIDAKTLREITTRYDERGRSVKRTVWLVARGTVDPDAPPIAGENSIPATDGLTTSWEYDDDLSDNAGLDSTYSNFITGLNLGSSSDGSAVLFTNAEAERTLTVYDGIGRKVREAQIDSSGAALTQNTLEYDSLVAIAGYGDVLQLDSTNLLSQTIKVQANGFDARIATLDADGNATSFEYDACGNLLSFVNANGVGGQRTYDGLRRCLSITDTRGSTTSTTYDAASNLISHTNGNGHALTHEYDARGERIESVDRLGHATQYSYDVAGNLLELTDSQSQTTVYQYDDAGRRNRIVWPDHVVTSSPGDPGYGITDFLLDGMGRTVSRVSQSGETVTMIFDLGGRMVQRDYRTAANSPSGTVTDSDTFTYDAANRMLTAVKGRYSNNTVTMSYDDAGRLASESLSIWGQQYTVGFTYTASGQRDTLTLPRGSVVDYGYNSRDQYASASFDTDGAGGNSPVTVASITYDTGGREVSRTHGNGLTTTNSFVTGSDLLSSVANSVVGTHSYTWDANANKVAEAISGAMAGHGFSGTTYDNADRLTAWSRTDTNLSQSWSLSDEGDWDTFTVNGTGQSRAHGNTHEISTVGGNSLAHDVNGNLTLDEAGVVFDWDQDNMLSSVVVPSGASVGNVGTHYYLYDALGRRIGKTVQSGMNYTTTYFVHADSQVVAEYAAGAGPSSPLREYVYGAYVDELLALNDRTSAGATGAGSDELLYGHQSHQFHTVALTNSAGSAVERYAYTPYGQLTITDGAGTTTLNTSDYGNAVTYTGQRNDEESGLYYFRRRMFHPRLGRFLGRDLLEYTDGQNLYASYFAMNGVDPSGLLHWRHHWLAQEHLDRMNDLCGPMFDALGVTGRQFIDQFTSQLGNTSLGTIHNYVQWHLQGGHWNDQVGRRLDNATSCCDFLGQMGQLMNEAYYEAYSAIHGTPPPGPIVYERFNDRSRNNPSQDYSTFVSAICNPILAGMCLQLIRIPGQFPVAVYVPIERVLDPAWTPSPRRLGGPTGTIGQGNTGGYTFPDLSTVLDKLGGNIPPPPWYDDSPFPKPWDPRNLGAPCPVCP